MEMESVFLDNLPDTANMILNILWDRNEEMCTAELTEAVNEVYNRRWEKGLIQEFIKKNTREGGMRNAQKTRFEFGQTVGRPGVPAAGDLPDLWLALDRRLPPGAHRHCRFAFTPGGLLGTGFCGPVPALQK